MVKELNAVYAVIFRARIRQLDDGYYEVAQRLRELALNRYGCLEFVSASEGDEELAISYWESEAQIAAWKNDPQHVKAQANSHKWYASYQVEVCELRRQYRNSRRGQKD